MANEDDPIPDSLRRPTGPRPLGGLADLAELLGGETPGSRRFLRGLAVGALVGVAFAGSSLMRRRRRAGETDEGSSRS